MPGIHEWRRALEKHVARAASTLLDALHLAERGMELGFSGHELIVFECRDPMSVDVVRDNHGSLQNEAAAKCGRLIEFRSCGET
jgi:hypothetical protein